VKDWVWVCTPYEVRGDYWQELGSNDGGGTETRTMSVSTAERQNFRAPVTYLMGWLSEVLMRSLVANTSLLLESGSSMAAEISCARFPPRGIAHSCGHSAEGIVGGGGCVAIHHAWMSARDSWWALMNRT
jgi:hypothetical protein